MTKNSKQKLLFMTLFLTVLLVSSAYAALIPNVHAADMTTQQKGLAILNDVVGLDLAKYDVTIKEYQQDTQASYLGVVPQNSLDYTLTSGESKLRMFLYFC
jgi:hypothetical protein